MLKRAVPFVLLAALAFAQVSKPERRVDHNIITSEHDPGVRVELPASVHYLGADRWTLYGIADCELHAWVEADAQKRVHRLYWVQFEGYIPSRPELQHQYDSPRHITMGGMDFFVDTWPRANNETMRSGSDREHIETLVRANGYSMPDGMMYVRLVHLLDPEKRKELMIIYGEDLAPTGFTAGQLQKGGSAHEQWPRLEKELVERAQSRIKLSPAEPVNR